MSAGPSKRAEDGADELAPGVRLAGSDVVEAVRAGFLDEVQRHVDRVLDVEKVAPLLAVRELGPIALEQPHATGLQNLPERLVHDAPHVALVVLVRPEHVEVLQPDDPIEVAARRRVQVEELLRIAVHVERPQRRDVEPVGHPTLDRAVGRRRRCVGEADPALERPLGEHLRVVEVVLDEVAAVGLGRRRTRAQMNDRPHVVEQPELDLVAERVGLEVVVEAQRRRGCATSRSGRADRPR